MKKILCATLDGADAKIVEVESTFTRALPSFSIVGLAGSTIQEAKDRVKSALLANDFTFPPLKITINLSPSEIKKSGSHFDLAIALSIALQKENIDLSDTFVFGELGLDGKVKDTQQIFPLLLSLSKRPIKAIVPAEGLAKYSKIPGITLYGVASLTEAKERIVSGELSAAMQEELDYETVRIEGENYYFQRSYPIDFYDVRGQEQAKRAALIAAAGMHNILLEGSPGCGKSMIAKRLRYILPPMHLSEILEAAKMRALAGEEVEFSPLRPFRSPHHSSTNASLFGGGSSQAKPGEVALVHLGMLFFDELPHFSKSALEALREPLQDRRLLISRVNTKVEYPTSFMFVAAQNPCPCGNLLSTTKECRCTELEIKRYKNRLSEPLLDRIELFVQMSEVSSEDVPTVRSEQMHEKVLQAFAMQKRRGQRQLNGKLAESEIERFCRLDSEAEAVLERAVANFSLSQRSIDNIKKVSRTIADLDAQERIGKAHVLEALSYRRR